MLAIELNSNTVKLGLLGSMYALYCNKFFPELQTLLTYLYSKNSLFPLLEIKRCIMVIKYILDINIHIHIYIFPH